MTLHSITPPAPCAFPWYGNWTLNPAVIWPCLLLPSPSCTDFLLFLIRKLSLFLAWELFTFCFQCLRSWFLLVIPMSWPQRVFPDRWHLITFSVCFLLQQQLWLFMCLWSEFLHPFENVLFEVTAFVLFTTVCLTARTGTSLKKVVSKVLN